MDHTRSRGAQHRGARVGIRPRKNESSGGNRGCSGVRVGTRKNKGSISGFRKSEGAGDVAAELQASRDNVELGRSRQRDGARSEGEAGGALVSEAACKGDRIVGGEGQVRVGGEGPTAKGESACPQGCGTGKFQGTRSELQAARERVGSGQGQGGGTGG